MSDDPRTEHRRADLAPWVASVLDRLARVTGEFGGEMSDDEIRVALREELDAEPRPVTLEELARGCAIATELMKIEATEQALSDA
jgi:hypothetical protein